jgi:malonyl-CoA O-methyltransferase
MLVMHPFLQQQKHVQMRSNFFWGNQTMIDKQLLQKRFSLHAKTYDRYAQVQKQMAGQLLTALDGPNLPDKARILEIGCGTGYLTKALCTRFPQAQIFAVDLAPGMIEVAKEKVRLEQVTFICGDIEQMNWQKSFDLIISNATFQWFNQLELTLKKLFSSLTTNGMILFSTFGCDTFRELHTSFQRALSTLQLQAEPPGQSFYSLAELLGLCRQALGEFGEIPCLGTQDSVIEHFPSVKDFLTSVKKIGASNSNLSTIGQRPSVLKEMMRIYEQEVCAGMVVQATYHVLCMLISSQPLPAKPTQ